VKGVPEPGVSGRRAAPEHGEGLAAAARLDQGLGERQARGVFSDLQGDLGRHHGLLGGADGELRPREADQGGRHARALLEGLLVEANGRGAAALGEVGVRFADIPPRTGAPGGQQQRGGGDGPHLRPR